MTSTLYTIGHSRHDIQTFIGLLQRQGITALADVRSHPYSRHAPQYCHAALKSALSQAGIAHVFLGRELGARSRNPACYENGKVQYHRLAEEPAFLEGIDRIYQGMSQYRIALMCAEKDPIACHRALLVARVFHEAGIEVLHIQAHGALETHHDLESRLLALHQLPEGDLFRSRKECAAEAYRIQAERVAYRDETMFKPSDKTP